MRKPPTRDRLIATAAGLFHRQGYAGTGVNEIIGGACATSGSFYHFFETKEELLMAVVDHLGATMGERIFDAAGGDDPVSGVLVAARAYLEEAGAGLGSPVGTLAAELSVSHPRVRERIARLYEEWGRRIEARMEAGGSFAATDPDLRRAARAVVGILEGAMLQARVHGDLEAFDATAALLRDHLPTRAPDPAEGTLSRRTQAPQRAPSPSRADWRSW